MEVDNDMFLCSTVLLLVFFTLFLRSVSVALGMND